MSLDILVTAGFDGYIKHANPAFERTLGWTAEDLRKRPYLELVHPDDRERTAAEATALAAGSYETRDFELRFAHRDGGWRWILFSAQAGLEEQLLYAVGKDITERREVEEELRDAVRRFETVAESANDAIVSAEEDGRIAFWNERARTMFGYEPEDILGRELATLMPERLRDDHRRGFARYLETGRAHVIGRTVELVGLRSDGTEFPLELSLGEWRRGERRAFTGVIRDLGERKRTERYLAAQFLVATVLAESPTLEDAAPRFLAAIGESMGWQVGGLWTPEPDGRHVRCRAAWYEAGAQVEAFRRATMEIALERGEGLPGRVWASGEPVWIRDAGAEPNFPRGGAAAQSGLHGGIGLPLLSGGEIVGAVDFFSAQIQEPDPALIDLMGTIGTQLGGFVQRKQAQAELAATAAELQVRAAELERSNADLEQFAYVASTTCPSRCAWSPASRSCCSSATSGQARRRRGRVHRLRRRRRQPHAGADRRPARVLARRARRPRAEPTSTPAASRGDALDALSAPARRDRGGRRDRRAADGARRRPGSWASSSRT